MADLINIGNQALVVLVLFTASLAIWLVVFWNVWRGQAPLAWAPRDAVSWPALPVCAAFLIAFYLPALVVPMLVPGLARVEQLCLAAVAQMAIVVGLLALAGPLDPKDFGCHFADWRADLQSGAAGYLASLGPVFLTILLVEKLGWRSTDDKHSLLKLLDEAPTAGVVGWVVLAAVVLAPLAEELLFRVLLQGWTQSQVRPAKAIAFSSFIFCLSHALGDVVPLVPLALILGYVYYRRRSYLAVVILHALFNGTMVTLSRLPSGQP